jgi:hypothetical protein
MGMNFIETMLVQKVVGSVIDHLGLSDRVTVVEVMAEINKVSAGSGSLPKIDSAQVKEVIHAICTAARFLNANLGSAPNTQEEATLIQNVVSAVIDHLNLSGSVTVAEVMDVLNAASLSQADSAQVQDVINAVRSASSFLCTDICPTLDPQPAA